MVSPFFKHCSVIAPVFGYLYVLRQKDLFSKEALDRLSGSDPHALKRLTFLSNKDSLLRFTLHIDRRVNTQDAILLGQRADFYLCAIGYFLFVLQK